MAKRDLFSLIDTHVHMWSRFLVFSTTHSKLTFSFLHIIVDHFTAHRPALI